MNPLKKSVLFFLLPSALFLIGCFDVKQPARKIDYYSFEYDPPVHSWKNQLPVNLRIEDFRIADPYDTRKIIYREDAFRKDAYVYHRWWAKPNELVTGFMARDFRKSDLFRAVLEKDPATPATHVLKGMVMECYEKDGPDTWEAVLSVDITLMTEAKADLPGKILLQKQFRAVEVCAEKSPLALAKAMSLAMSRVSEEVFRDLYTLLDVKKETKRPLVEKKKKSGNE